MESRMAGSSVDERRREKDARRACNPTGVFGDASWAAAYLA
jgi:hypothetical protein